MKASKLLGRVGIAGLGILAVAMTVPLLMRASVARYIVPLEEAPRADAAVVLGASVVRGAPSPLLAKRADTAIALYQKGAVGKILVTGDDSALSHDEVTPVRKYLLDRGVREEDIFLDHAGFDTYSSMYRAGHIFGIRTLIIATQDFHISRALWIARSLGLEAYATPAWGGGGSNYDVLREIPASLKALFDVASHRAPKYLGEKIPITGDGRETWY